MLGRIFTLLILFIFSVRAWLWSGGRDQRWLFCRLAEKASICDTTSARSSNLRFFRLAAVSHLVSLHSVTYSNPLYSVADNFGFRLSQRGERAYQDMWHLADSRGDLPQRQIDWQVSALPTVSGDAELLRRVITALVDNAVKFTRNRERA